jgi:hypothetical protein
MISAHFDSSAATHTQPHIWNWYLGININNEHKIPRYGLQIGYDYSQLMELIWNIHTIKKLHDAELNHFRSKISSNVLP